MDRTLICPLLLLLGIGWPSASLAQFRGGDTSVGYIDSAIVRNQVRFRFDASYDNPTPDRAEFLYPKCGCFRIAPPPLTDPNAPGPPLSETGIDFQEFSLYAESLLLSDLISGFVEIPFRLINPEKNNNTGGLSDINLGLKAAVWMDETKLVTFQFRTYLPSGDGFDGLGTEHVSLEPALLVMTRYGDGTTIEGELRDFIPIDGSEGFAGNVLRYGLGLSQTWLDDGRFSIKPVVEGVAWSVLSGSVLRDVDTSNERVDSAKTTIANIKVGVRFNLAPKCCGDGTKSLYVGYGKALTGSRWYDDTLRAEYRLIF